MKKAIIVHGWDFNPKMNWYPWLKEDLEKKGYEVIVPTMPKTSEPKINAWVSHLNKVIEKLDENTILIGHSIGCQTIMRYLETKEYSGKVRVIFVAGWFTLDNLESKEVESIARPWLETPINFDKVRQKINKIVVFLSDNDPYDFVEENKKIFENKLGSKVFILKNKGHFTEEDNIKKLPEILQFIK